MKALMDNVSGRLDQTGGGVVDEVTAIPRVRSMGVLSLRKRERGMKALMD